MANNIKVLLTIKLEGGLTGAVSNAGSKKEKQKMKKSAFWFGKGDLPKGYYFSQKKYVERPQVLCIQRLKLTEEQYKSFIAPIPKPKTKETPAEARKRVWWNKLTTKERLEFHLGEISATLQGTSFSYELID